MDALNPTTAPATIQAERTRRPPMRAYLRTLFLLTTAPLVLLAGALSLNTAFNERETVKRSMTDVARALSSALDGEVGRAFLALDMLARGRAFDGPDWGRARELAEALRNGHGGISNVALFGVDGERIFNLRVSPGQEAPAPTGRDFLRAAREGKRYASNVYVSPTSKRPSVALSVPVVVDGQPRYVISAISESTLWTDWLHQRIPAGAIAAVDDRQGIVFARSERPEGFAGQPANEDLRQAYDTQPEGIVRVVNKEGVALYAAFHTSPVTGWRTLVLRPGDTVDGPLIRYTTMLFFGTVAVLLIAYLVSTLLVQRLEKGAAALRDAIGAVGEGRAPERRSLPVAELDEAHAAAEHAARLLRRTNADLQRREQELRAMFDVMPVGLLLAHDARADHITVSPSFAALTGLPAGANISMSGDNRGQLPYRYVRGGRALDADDLPMQRAARRGEAVRDLELDMVFDNGRVLNLLFYAAPLLDSHGNRRGAIGASVDITALKQAQRELESADRQKNAFLATLAHELRNPLAPIRYATALLQRDPDGATRGRTVQIIDRQAAHMARLLDDLLDLSRITRGVVELRREPVELHAILTAAAENTRPMLDEHRHRFETTIDAGPLWVFGDPARLLQVIDNLLNNACKYTDDGGRVTLGARREGNQCVIEVSDTGIGIVPEKVHDVFRMFGQVNPNAQAARGGLGIGLAVVHRLVELHGGTIGVASPGAGRGSTFTVTLPWHEHVAPSQPAEPAPADASGLATLKVLVVDDNVDAAETLAAVLGIAGIKTRTAHTAAQAWREADAFRPDAVLLDLGLPDGSGLDVARRLRATEWGRHALLAALTGWGRSEDRAETQAAGFDTHLVKPVDPNQVIALLTKHASPLPSPLAGEGQGERGVQR